jgi:hypothetical protein
MSKYTKNFSGGPRVCVCVYYCRTYYKAVRGTREEPGTLTQGAPVFPGSSRLGIEPKTPGWLVQDPTTRPIGDLIPTIGGSGAHQYSVFSNFSPMAGLSVKYRFWMGGVL